MRRKKFFAILICVSLILGIGSAVTFADPVELTRVNAPQSISLGARHSAAIMSDRTLWMAGSNENGQLGAGHDGKWDIVDLILEDVSSVSLGQQHSAAITDDGSLWIWGWNLLGQLGTGDKINRNAPVKIMDDVSSVSLGSYHSAAVKSDGSLWIWGYNAYGSLGTGDKYYHNYLTTPEKIMDDVSSVSLGGTHSAAIKNDGSLWIWGNNEYGQLGTGDKINRNAPVKIMDDVSSVSLGEYRSAAIKSDGSLWTWGYGQTTPVKIMDNVSSVSLGGGHSAAVKSDGSLWIWGNNAYGQLGTGDNSDRNAPVKIMDNVSYVSLGGGHSAAVKNDGSLWTWGNNEYFQLGITDWTNQYKPVKVMDKILLPGSSGEAADHEHELIFVPAKSPTCTEDGNTEYWVCSGGENPCGKYFGDAEGTTEIEAKDVILPALGHDFGSARYEWAADNSTCTGRRICLNDSSHVIENTVTVSSVVTKEPTATEPGERTFTAVFEGEEGFTTQTKTEAIPWEKITEPAKNGGSVRTGDSNNILFWIVVMLGALLAVSVSATVIIKRKERFPRSCGKK